MKWKAMLMACAFLSQPLLAHDHDNHEHEDDAAFDVEAYALTLQGTQPFGDACYIGVITQGQDPALGYFAEVETSFNHEGIGPGRLHVTLDLTRPGYLAATTASGARISIQLAASGVTIADALRYAVRWTHEDHVDTGLCNDLKVVHDASQEEAEAQP